MAQEPLLVNLRKTVATAEALRRDLLRDLHGAEEGERSAVRLEMILFYGNAFALVLDTLTGPLEPESPAVSAHRAAFWGRAVFQAWLNTGPSADVEQRGTLERIWAQITRAVLDDQA